jgi:hypothetical protein
MANLTIKVKREEFLQKQQQQKIQIQTRSLSTCIFIFSRIFSKNTWRFAAELILL